MKVFASILLSSALLFSSSLTYASAPLQKTDVVNLFASIVKKPTFHYGEMEAYPPNTHPFKIEFANYNEEDKSFSGFIQYLNDTHARSEFTGSILGSEIVFKETGKPGVFTLSELRGNKIAGVWRGNSTFGGEITKEVWFEFLP